MVLGLIGLGLIFLIIGYKYFYPVKKNTTTVLVNTTNVNTVNVALEKYLDGFDVYVVKYLYFIDGRDNVIQEKIFDTGTNIERHERAERFYKLMHQNILTQQGMGNSTNQNPFLISLSRVEKQNGIEKVSILKQLNSETQQPSL